MPEPKGLSFGKPAAPVAPAAPMSAPPLDMPISAPVAGQAVTPYSGPPQSPFTMENVMDFGRDVELSASSVVQKINSATRAGDLDVVGKKLNQLTVAGQQYDPTKLGKGGLFGLFKRKKRELEAHFKSVDAQVNTIAGDLEQQIRHFAGRINDVKALADENIARHADLGRKIEEGERRIAWMRANPPAVDPSDAFSSQKLATWNQVIAFAEKRVGDMRSTRMLCELYGPQIDMMGTNAVALVMTFGDVKTTTLPQMQFAFAAYIINMETEKGADFIKNVRDTNNELIKQNAAKLGAATIKVRQEMGRGSVDMSTLEFARDQFFQTLDRVKQIEAETTARLASERPKLEQMSQDLMQRLGQAA